VNPFYLFQISQVFHFFHESRNDIVKLRKFNENINGYQNVDILRISNVESGELDGDNWHNFTIGFCVYFNFFHKWALNWLQREFI